MYKINSELTPDKVFCKILKPNFRFTNLKEQGRNIDLLGFLIHLLMYNIYFSL